MDFESIINKSLELKRISPSNTLNRYLINMLSVISKPYPIIIFGDVGLGKSKIIKLTAFIQSQIKSIYIKIN